MTQARMSERLEISQKHLSQMLIGNAQFTPDWADRLLAHCGRRLVFSSEPREGVDMTEAMARREYLKLLNEVLDLARRIIVRSPAKQASWVYEDYEKLVELGNITTLRQATQVEKIGWSLSDFGTDGMATIGYALVLAAEQYNSRYPIDERMTSQVTEQINELKAWPGLNSSS